MQEHQSRAEKQSWGQCSEHHKGCVCSLRLPPVLGAGGTEFCWCEVWSQLSVLAIGRFWLMRGLGWPSEGMQVLAVGLVQLEFSGVQKRESLEQPTRWVADWAVGCALEEPSGRAGRDWQRCQANLYLGTIICFNDTLQHRSLSRPIFLTVTSLQHFQ